MPHGHKDSSKKSHKSRHRKKKKHRHEEEGRSEKKRRREAKARMKAGETKEERRERRLAKRAKKRRKHQAEDLFGYSNESNPFGDQQITKVFVWQKKYEKEIEQGLDPSKLTKARMLKQRDQLREEILKVRERRAKHAKEKADLEELREAMDRERNMADDEDWEAKDEEFHLKQAQLRSRIRVREGREKAVDILAKNLTLATDPTGAEAAVDFEVEVAEPQELIERLSRRELADLRQDVQDRIALGSELPYWNAVAALCKEEEEQWKLQEKGLQAAQELLQRSGVSLESRDQIDTMLSGQSLADLRKLEVDVARRLAGRDEVGGAVDTEFWEALQSQLTFMKARAFLREFHERLLQSRLDQLKADVAAGRLPSTALDRLQGTPHTARAAPQRSDWSPVLEHGADALEKAISADVDALQLEEARRAVVAKYSKTHEVEDTAEAFDASLDEEAIDAAGMRRFMTNAEIEELRETLQRTMGDDEEEYEEEVEIEVPKEAYSWHDRYRPRKPRYFNRVKTGYDWNKFNQAHYDRENPPPKVVQGYKFNIFYPDLIDVTQGPSYEVTKDPQNPDFCTITFKAGAPYEDIAFKIVRKSWDHNPKRGFRSVFDRGCLHLYFNFRRVFYRR